MKTKYQATKTSSNRPGWSVTFKHPKRSDSRGRPGLKIRKGLGTKDGDEADRLVAQLNQLLSDERWWSVDRRKEAEQQFAPVITKAFFDGMEAGKMSPAERRESRISIPTNEEGYSRVLFTGTTGAGKTTLLRHMIGSSHAKDRFPSTSTARTTTAEIEIVTAEGPFETAITFMPDHEVRAHVDECLEEACLRAAQGQSDEKIIGALLSHREQRFRLSYILGAWNQSAVEDAEDEFAFDDDEAADDELGEGEATSSEEIAKNRRFLENLLHRIKSISAAVAHSTAAELGELHELEGPEEKAAWLEIFGESLYDHEDFSRAALDIMDAVEDRFEFIEAGEFEKGPTGWPVAWSYSSTDREQFLRQVRWFSSNHHGQFGKLLTPLVDGVRARGPFFPNLGNAHSKPKLVLLDGEGIGHTAKSSSSISTRITRRFPDADLILIVDNAEQPMQTAPLELLRSIGTSGNADKLAVAFTHFDLVKGPNLRRQQQKQDHVLDSVRDAISTLRQSIGASIAASLEERMDNASFFLGGLDRETGKIPKGFIGEIQRLLETMQASGAPPEPVDAAPIYTTEGLEIALRDAVEGFQQPWKARLGLSYHDGVAKEHWTRVKALSRRFAMAWSNEYDDMRPVADLVARMQESISRWLDTPAGWTRQPEDDEERTAALGIVRKTVYAALHTLADERLAELHRREWTAAYDYSGRGSSYDRADEIRGIYEEAAPTISSAMNDRARLFLHELHRIVRDAVAESGGQFKSGSTEQ